MFRFGLCPKRPALAGLGVLGYAIFQGVWGVALNLTSPAKAVILVATTPIFGAIFARRSVSTVGEGSNETYGVDAAFSLYDNVDFGAYWSRTHTPGLEAEDVSYQAEFSYNPDRYGFQVSHLLVGENFNPEVGFLRRDDFRNPFDDLYWRSDQGFHIV